MKVIANNMNLLLRCACLSLFVTSTTCQETSKLTLRHNKTKSMKTENIFFYEYDYDKLPGIAYSDGK